MIKALEARARAMLSDLEIDKILKKLNVDVIEAASKGQRELACYKSTDWTSELTHINPVSTPVQKRLIEVLKSLGYEAAVEKNGDYYIPRSMEEDCPMHVNHVLVIRW